MTQEVEREKIILLAHIIVIAQIVVVQEVGDNRNSSLSNVENRSGNNCGTLCNGDPNTTACRTCACQRQFRNCLRRVQEIKI